jgi:NAD(P)-dependent dehydrogenase (short-subunit alcohol dehydrogenase family)
MNTPKVWLVTGAGSGFGRAITSAATEAGDIVVGTSRKPGGETVQLDITDTAAITRVVNEVIAEHGRIDVLVNNAGRGQVGALEETTDAELRSLFDVHVFGPAALARAVLPHMRARRSGAIVQMSSFGGRVSMPGFSAYCGTKFALEGMSEALAEEVRPLGITVLIVEPGAFRTSFSGPALHESTTLDAYAATVGPTRSMIKGIDGTQPGDPDKAAFAILAALDADQTPLRLPLGNDSVDAIIKHAEEVRSEMTAWEHISRSTDFTASG